MNLMNSIRLAALSALVLSGCSGDPIPTTSGRADGGGGGGASNADAGATQVDAGETGVDAGDAPGCAPIGTPLAMGAAPSQRGDMAYAYDPKCQRMYLFSGDEGVPMRCSAAGSIFIDDMWVYDLTTRIWSQLTPTGANKPLPRARSVGSWDAARERFIVFGGRWRSASSGPYTFLNDLWAYDPATNEWTELSGLNAVGGPSGRMNSAMVSDAMGDRVIVHAGGTTDFLNFFVNNETWAFDLAAGGWSRIAMGGLQPPARLFHAMTLDTSRRRVYIFGGGGETAFQGPFYDDMWYLDLANDTWTEIPKDPAFPDQRIKPKMDYDAVNDQILLFGGHDLTDLGNTNQLFAFNVERGVWELKILGDVLDAPARAMCDFPGNFTEPDLQSPERRESHLFAVTGSHAMLFGGRTDCGISNDTWHLDPGAYAWSQINDSFTGMTCFRAGRSDCREPTSDMCN